MSLRMAEAEAHLKQQTKILNMSYVNEDKFGMTGVEKEMDS